MINGINYWKVSHCNYYHGNNYGGNKIWQLFFFVVIWVGDYGQVCGDERGSSIYGRQWPQHTYLARYDAEKVIKTLCRLEIRFLIEAESTTLATIASIYSDFPTLLQSTQSFNDLFSIISSQIRVLRVFSLLWCSIYLLRCPLLRGCRKLHSMRLWTSMWAISQTPLHFGLGWHQWEKVCLLARGNL